MELKDGQCLNLKEYSSNGEMLGFRKWKGKVYAVVAKGLPPNDDLVDCISHSKPQSSHLQSGKNNL